MRRPINNQTPKQIKSVVSKKWDFWLLGGASILLWAGLLILDLFKNTPYEHVKMAQLAIMGAVFQLFTVFFNQPHFISSYFIGYSQGKKFILENWLPMIAVPGLLFSLFATAFFNFDSIGMQLMASALLIMNLTIGWHYSQQVYGCVVVYSKYDNYHLSKEQKLLIKVNLFLLGLLNFLAINKYYVSLGSEFQKFLGIEVFQLQVPNYLIESLSYIVLASAIAILYFVGVRNYRLNGQIPSRNTVVAFVSFYIWWLPMFHQQEFYFVAVPFFHSIQYLAFVYKRRKYETIEEKGIENYKKDLKKQAMLWLGIGFLSFQAVPFLLDLSFDSLNTKGGVVFFLASMGVFINIHHFFIDSVIWKFKNKKVEKALA